ncbi:transposase, partial [Suttonella ornithocola]|uniref:transposase n=1 Tax=Suttonella ornithocola TaxID=279832 RepID=UPI001B8039CD
AFHKRSDIQAIIEEHGHEIVWLPPYSPDLNPIEKMWAWIKQIAKNGGWIVLILYSFICFGLGWVLDDCTIFAVGLYDDSINSDVFYSWVEQI